MHWYAIQKKIPKQERKTVPDRMALECTKNATLNDEINFISSKFMRSTHIVKCSSIPEENRVQRIRRTVV